MTIRWGIIGCGKVTERKSGPAFQKAEGSRLMGVMRRDAALVEDYAKRHGVPLWTTSAAELIHHPEIDALYIASPPGSHLELALEARRAGKPVYVEKPLARNFRECREMVEAFASGGIPLFVAYYRRALPRFLKVRELISSGEIGQVVSISYRYSNSFHLEVNQSNLPWRVQAEHSGGGLFLDLGCHTLDIFDFLFGPLTDVSGLAANLSSPYGVEDNVAMVFRTSNGALGTASWSFSNSGREDLISIYGTRGKIALSTFGDEPVTLEVNQSIREFSLPNPFHIQQPLIQSIVDQLKGKGLCPSTGESASRTSKVMDLVLRDYYGDRERDFWAHPAAWPGRNSELSR